MLHRAGCHVDPNEIVQLGFCLVSVIFHLAGYRALSAM
jgi:hypothetical protein